MTTKTILPVLSLALFLGSICTACTESTGEPAPTSKKSSEAALSSDDLAPPPAQPTHGPSDYDGNPVEAPGSKELKLASDGGNCVTVDALVISHTNEIDALCEDPLVALSIASDNDGCNYGETRGLTFRCYSIDNQPTPPELPTP